MIGVIDQHSYRKGGPHIAWFTNGRGGFHQFWAKSPVPGFVVLRVNRKGRLRCILGASASSRLKQQNSPNMEVSWGFLSHLSPNHPFSSILIGSTITHPFLGTSIYGNPQGLPTWVTRNVPKTTKQRLAWEVARAVWKSSSFKAAWALFLAGNRAIEAEQKG